MAIKRTKYNYTLDNGTDIFHFQTDDKQVKILDSNKNIVGSVKEFAMEGKVVSGGSFTDLKVSGLYKVTGLSGLPSGYATNKISILSVKSVGEINNPEMSFYTIISQDGEVFDNTVVGNNQSGWTAGGVNLDSTIKKISDRVGDNSNLKTKAKANLVNAINEVYSTSADNKNRLDKFGSDFDEYMAHNHDARYLRKSGDEMTGSLVFGNSNYIRTKSANGAHTYNLIGVNSSNTVTVGESSRPLNLLGSDLVLNNNRKVWHEGNHGTGSGLDADLLGGQHSSVFARLNGDNRFVNSVMSDKNLYTGQHLVFGTSWSGKRARIWADSNGIVSIGDSNPVKITSSGRIEMPNDIRIKTTNNTDPSIRLKGNGSGTGTGFVVGRNSGDLVLRSWDNNDDGFRYRAETGRMEFGKSIRIQGRLLFLQNSRPTGSIPTGSIWIS